MKKINFKNKTVVISGGGTGIGYQIAKSFLEAQAKVIILGRRKERGEVNGWCRWSHGPPL